MTSDIIIQIENNIVDAFERWLPFVELRDIQVNNKSENNQVDINIVFNLNRTPNSIESVQVTFDGGPGGASTITDGAY
jgi:hypothetical protein